MKAAEGTTLVGVRLPVALHRRLKVEAVRRGLSMAALVEAAVRSYLDRKGRDQ